MQLSRSLALGLLGLLPFLGPSSLATAQTATTEVELLVNARPGDFRTGWIDFYDAGYPYGLQFRGHPGEGLWGQSLFQPSHDYRANIFFETAGLIPAGASVQHLDFLYAHSLSYTSGPPIAFAAEIRASRYTFSVQNGGGNASAYAFYPSVRGAIESFEDGPETRWINIDDAKGEVRSNTSGVTLQLRDRSGAIVPATWGSIIDLPRCKLRIRYEIPAATTTAP